MREELGDQRDAKIHNSTERRLNPTVCRHCNQVGLRTFRYRPREANLPPLQWLVAQLVSCGLADKDIAYLLGIAGSTVKSHNTKTLRMLGLSRRSQLIRYIIETRQFDPERAEHALQQRRVALEHSQAAKAKRGQ